MDNQQHHEGEKLATPSHVTFGVKRDNISQFDDTTVLEKHPAP
jgi:hypothetical protein